MNRQQNRTVPPSVQVSNITAPMGVLAGRRVLVLLDIDNITCGARDLKRQICYHKLAEKLRNTCATCRVHAYFSRLPGDYRKQRFFESLNWIPHPWDIEIAFSKRQGRKSRANADNLILFHAGVLSQSVICDSVIIGSGDGDLACDLARFVHEQTGGKTIFTMSLPGSTSSRLDSHSNQFITDNIKVGADIMPLHQAGQFQRPVTCDDALKELEALAFPAPK